MFWELDWGGCRRNWPAPRYASGVQKPQAIADALQGLLLDEVATKQYFDGCLSEAGPVWSR
jgi:hypothetical protein